MTEDFQATILGGLWASSRVMLPLLWPHLVLPCCQDLVRPRIGGDVVEVLVPQEAVLLQHLRAGNTFSAVDHAGYQEPLEVTERVLSLTGPQAARVKQLRSFRPSSSYARHE